MNKVKFLIIPVCILLFLILIPQSSNSCEPEKYTPQPEIIWPLDKAATVPIDTAIIVKDFKSLSKAPHKLNFELRSENGEEIEYEIKRFQSRRSVYNHEAGFVLVKPIGNLDPLKEYSFTVRATEGFADPINLNLKFGTGDESTLVTAPEKIEVSYYFSAPGYYLSNCQTSVWEKAASLVFINSKIDGYPLLFVLDSNLLKDVSFYHSSFNKRDLAVLFLPNEKGVHQCFDLSVYAVNGKKVFSEKLCKPEGCVEGRSLSKDEAEQEYKKHGAFGFSLIEFPAPKEEIPNYCTLYPPLCREYWSSLPSDKCEGS